MSLKTLVVLLGAVGLVAAGCSSSKNNGTSTSSPNAPVSTGSTTSTTVPLSRAYSRPACFTKPLEMLVAKPIPGSTSDYDIVSFDGTNIRVHWFPRKIVAGRTSPTVLEGPGWASAGNVDTVSTAADSLGVPSIRTLRANGYNVLTWDPRGFGSSGGTVESDGPDEGRDLVRLIDWVAQQRGVQLDARNDPRVGMVGASYGGGIQLVTAASDCRVDAIVPNLAWHSLVTSLYKAQVPKIGWGNYLYLRASGHSLDPHITSAHADSNRAGVLSAADVKWFADRGPGDSVSKITAPTLFEQGTDDTLFTLDEAATNYEALLAKGVPTAMLWKCSGHGVCLTNPGDQNRAGQAAIAWLARYLKHDNKVPVPARFEYVDQNGTEFTSGDFPLRNSAPITTTAGGTLFSLTAEGGAGPAHSSSPLSPLVAPLLAIMPAKASNAVNVPITVTKAAKIVGSPVLELQYTGLAGRKVQTTHVFAQLVDDSTGLVVGNQITPIEMILDGHQHDTTTPLEMVAFTAKPGDHLTLQIVATTTGYAQPRLRASLDFLLIKVGLPTVTGVKQR